jgi:hypothetical protein
LIRRPPIGKPEEEQMQLEQLQHPEHIRKRQSSRNRHAQLSSSDQCAALGIVGIGRTPALALCRQLLAAGVNPDRALTVYRYGILSLRIRSIREGAALTVKDSATGRPSFRPVAPQGIAATSPMRKNRRRVA